MAKPLTEDAHRETPGGKPRARALGIPLRGAPGRWNAITDVPALEVGHVTLIEGDAVRTGVTAIHPRGRASPADPCAAGVHSQNGNGEMTGTAWIAESGTMAGPVCLTNTHAVGVVHGSIVRWTVRHHSAVADAWLLPVAAETWDGYLNDINGGHVREETGVEALERAESGPVEEGSVGGGTGMNCYGFKGGIGTASRIVEHAGTPYAVGVLLQANFGGRSELSIAGVPLGKALGDDDPMGEVDVPPGTGSVIAIVATDAPLLPHQCTALARRVTLGLARTGTTGSHFSGDLFLALSTANAGAFAPAHESLRGRRPQPLDELAFVPWGSIDPFFDAVVQATEESVLDALVCNEEMTGIHGHRSPALPRGRVVELLEERGALA